MLTMPFLLAYGIACSVSVLSMYVVSWHLIINMLTFLLFQEHDLDGDKDERMFWLERHWYSKSLQCLLIKF